MDARRRYAADWVVNQVFRARVRDGIFPTFGANQVWPADHDSSDYRLDGTDTPDGGIRGFRWRRERGTPA